MPEYIEREAVQEILKKYSLGTRREIPIYPNEIIRASMDVDAIPAADVVPMAVHRQVMQERDLAIQQLREDYGVELGEKKADVVPVVHGRWIKQEGQWRMHESGESVNIHLCSCCGCYFRNAPYEYCPSCGARMDGE